MQFLTEIQRVYLEVGGLPFPFAAIFVVGATGALLVLFAGLFCIRAAILARRLKVAVIALDRPGSEGWSTDGIDRIFTGDGSVDRCWNDYREGRTRPWTSASAVFPSDMVVDGHLRIEVFRHLPVLFVVIAAIGVFLGPFAGIPENVEVAAPVAGIPADRMIVMMASLSAVVAAVLVAVIEYVQLRQCRTRLRQLVRALDGAIDGLREPDAAQDETPREVKAFRNAMTGELNRLLKEMSDDSGINAEEMRFVENLRMNVSEARANDRTVVSGSEVPEDVAREMRTLLKEMRAGFTQSLLELAEANRAVRDQVVRMMEETENRQRKILDELGSISERKVNRSGENLRSVEQG